MSWKTFSSLLSLDFLFLTILLAVLFICVVRCGEDRLFWDPNRLAETESEHAHCQGQEQSILRGLFSVILHSFEIGGKGLWRKMIASKQYSLGNAMWGEEQIARSLMPWGTSSC